MNILLWDLETSLMEAATFTLYPERIGHQNILKDWYIISGAWKFLGKPKIYAVSALDDPKRFKKDHRDDYHIVKTIRDVLEVVDVIIGHNQDKFDIKKFNARLIVHGLDPLPKMIHSVDTLKEVRKIAAFSSNRLDYLAKFLFGEGKIQTSEGLWLRALRGDEDAIREMVKYDKGDVKILEMLYLRLLPYMKSHPHVGAIGGKDKNLSCPHCGSTDMISKRTRCTASGHYRLQKQCSSCHSYSTFPFNENPKQLWLPQKTLV